MKLWFYTLQNLQDSQTRTGEELDRRQFYTLQNLQDSQTYFDPRGLRDKFYTLQNLQDSQTKLQIDTAWKSFTPFKTYKTLKPSKSRNW